MKKIIISLAFLLALSTTKAQVNWTTVGWTPQIKNTNGYREFRGGLGSSGFFNFTDSLKKAFQAIQNAPFIKNQTLSAQNGGLWLTGDIISAGLYGTNLGITGGTTLDGNVSITGTISIPSFPLNTDPINNTELLSRNAYGKISGTASSSFVYTTLDQSISGVKTFTSDMVLGTLAGIGVRSLAVDEEGKIVIGSGSGGGSGGVSLGESSSTAYRGDRGKTAYDYAIAHNLVDNTSDANKPVSTAVNTALASKMNLNGGNNTTGTQTNDGNTVVSSNVDGEVQSAVLNSSNGTAAKALLQATNGESAVQIWQFGVNYVNPPVTGRPFFKANGTTIYGTGSAGINIAGAAGVYINESIDQPVVLGNASIINVPDGSTAVDYLLTWDPVSNNVRKIPNVGFGGSDGGSPSYTFIDKAAPSGTINGSNLSFTIEFTPISGSEHLYLNGQLQEVGDDYTISGTTITFTIAPSPGDKLRISYRR